MKIIKELTLATMLTMASGAVLAETLTFEGFTGSLNSSTYGGFSWRNFKVFNASASNSGYRNGIVSGTNVAYNVFANPVTLSHASGFTLNNAYFVGAWNDGVTIQVVGTGSTSYTKQFVIDSTAATNVVFNWTGLTSVKFSSSGGTPHDGYDGAGSHFGMDNLTVNAAPVPEPETWAMLVAGLGLLGLAARRKKAAGLA